MTQSASSLANPQRARLLELIKRYYHNNHAPNALSTEEQEELERLVMSQLHMSLERAKVVLEQLARQSFEE
jgi:hypothetical protein